jgi:hypothetical protein
MKSTLSSVLLALLDAEYKIMYDDVWCIGRISDGEVFNSYS